MHTLSIADHRLPWVDCATLSAYLIAIAGIGLSFYRRKSDVREYFVASRQMPMVIVVMGLATWLLFMPPGKVGPVFLFGWLLVVYIGFSMSVLAQTSWASVLSPD